MSPHRFTRMTRVRAAAARSISSAAEEDRKFNIGNKDACKGLQRCKTLQVFYVLWGVRKQSGFYLAG